MAQPPPQRSNDAVGNVINPDWDIHEHTVQHWYMKGLKKIEMKTLNRLNIFGTQFVVYKFYLIVLRVYLKLDSMNCSKYSVKNITVALL